MISANSSRFSWDDENPSYDMFNGGKESLHIELKDPEQMKIMHNMLAKADVFLTSMRTGGLKKYGLDYDSLKGLSSESREKLKQVRPVTIAQAQRISGLRVSDIALLMMGVRHWRGKGDQHK